MPLSAWPQLCSRLWYLLLLLVLLLR